MSAATSSLRSFDYLEQLPETAFKRLYQQPSTALAVFRRFLPHLAKTFIMAMLFLSDPLPVAHLDLWVRPESKQYEIPCRGTGFDHADPQRHSEQNRAMDVLDRLKIISVVAGADQGSSYRITNPFCSSLRQALTGGGTHRSFGVPGGVPAADRVSMAVLGKFATAQWDTILYHVVGSSGTSGSDQIDLSDGTKTLLREAGFVELSGRTRKITEKGFTFLLQDIDAQVWSLLIEYLEYAGQELGLDNVDILSFLFTIGSLEVGQDYGIETLSETQKSILDDLHDFGIVYRPGGNANHFYPTPLASTITSDSSMLTDIGSKKNSTSSSSSGQRGFIVIETNYRIYAYTSSPLQIQILSLFTRLSTRYPNMVSGRLTKESIQEAIKLGITSQQIISYLTAHAHPIMTSQNRQPTSSSADGGAQQHQLILPPTVVDQIRLWQIEGDRMKTTPGFLFHKFADRTEFLAIADYADAIGVMVWRNNDKQVFFATRYEQIEKFIGNRRNRAAQATANASGQSAA